MKKIRLILVTCFMLLLVSPFSITAATADGDVGSYLSVNQCTSSKYQDAALSLSGDTFFSHCIKATCNSSGSYKLEYNNTQKSIRCTNGNNDPYYQLQKTGCGDIESARCNSGHITYCSLIMYYDCGRYRDGSSFETTSKTTQTKTYKPTQKPVVTVAPSNTKLESLKFSNGVIDFKPEIYKYRMNLDTIVNSVEVTAVPQDKNSKIDITGNTNIKDGSEIIITVTGTDGSTSIYKVIIVKKEASKLSSNTRLESLEVEGYSIPFTPRVTAYTLPISEGVTEVEIDAKPEDSSSVVTVSDNTNLKNGSKITITVTAEDGSVGYYYINVTVKQKSNFIKILFIIILILALGAGGFYMYKKFMASKEGEKYEYE